MTIVKPQDLSDLGKKVVAGFLGVGSLMQIPQVSNAVGAFVKWHPHWAGIIGMVTGLGLLLTNPQVQKVLHINQQSAAPDGSLKTQELTLTETTTKETA